MLHSRTIVYTLWKISDCILIPLQLIPFSDFYYRFIFLHRIICLSNIIITLIKNKNTPCELLERSDALKKWCLVMHVHINWFYIFVFVLFHSLVFAGWKLLYLHKKCFVKIYINDNSFNLLLFITHFERLGMTK